MKNSNRWVIACAGILLQIALGAVYAWSVFKVPLTRQFGWTTSQLTLTFTICIMALGFSAFFAGLWLKKAGTRKIALIGAVFYGGGIILAGFSGVGIWWLYLSYGLISGIGLGFAYIVPIAVIVKWFPDKRGLMTGIAVGGFGVGALIMAPIATSVINSVGVLATFVYLGLALLVIATTSAYFMQNPPEGWQPEGWSESKVKSDKNLVVSFTFKEAVKTWQIWALWILLFLNSSAGITIISQEVPIFQELAGVTVLAAAGMIGVVSIGNALGRIVWASVSDFIGRKNTFALIFCLQIILFWILPMAHSSFSITAIVFIILMCYGGGFGTMPSFAADYFGPLNVGAIYGIILTAWGFASAFGPLLIAQMRQVSGNYNGGLHVIAIIMAVSAIVPFFIKPPAKKSNP